MLHATKLGLHRAPRSPYPAIDGRNRSKRQALQRGDVDRVSDGTRTNYFSILRRWPLGA
jgi:hypothetical protein